MNAIPTQRHDCVWSYQGYMTKQALEQRKLLHLTTKNCSFHSFLGLLFTLFQFFFAPASTILTLMNYCFENEFKKFHLQQHFVVELLSDGDIMWIEHDGGACENYIYRKHFTWHIIVVELLLSCRMCVFCFFILSNFIGVVILMGFCEKVSIHSLCSLSISTKLNESFDKLLQVLIRRPNPIHEQQQKKRYFIWLATSKQ